MRKQIWVDETICAILKRNAKMFGMTMSDVIGAALETFEKRSDMDKQKSAAVWMACRAFWQGMQEKK